MDAALLFSWVWAIWMDWKVGSLVPWAMGTGSGGHGTMAKHSEGSWDVYGTTWISGRTGHRWTGLGGWSEPVLTAYSALLMSSTSAEEDDYYRITMS
eukprot:scaffold58223_cov34-Attheya_sp.AAC.4